MPRYIDAEFVEKEIASLVAEYEKCMPEWSPNDMLTSGRDAAMKFGYKADGAEKALEIVNKTPTADVEPVRHGHWIHGVCGKDKYIKCSFCRKSIVNTIVTLEGDDAETAFVICPRCGAKMDGGDGK